MDSSRSCNHLLPVSNLRRLPFRSLSQELMSGIFPDKNGNFFRHDDQFIKLVDGDVSAMH
jgi:hypothetical protein